MSVPYIAPNMLEKIMTPSAAVSLRASADAFHRMGLDFDAQLCRTMADDATAIGDQLYRTWARQQAERVIAKQDIHGGNGQ